MEEALLGKGSNRKLRRDYSYGLFVGENAKASPLVGHDGISWGYSTVMLVAPEQKAGIAAFVHGGNTLSRDLWSFAEKAIAKLTGIQPIKKQDSISLSELEKFAGTYRLSSYDASYTEAKPKFYTYEVALEFDQVAKKLIWIDEYGRAPMQKMDTELSKFNTIKASITSPSV